MLRGLWNKLVGRETDAAAKRETELEQMSPAERRFATEGVENIAAGEVSNERLGGGDPSPGLGEHDEPSRS